MSRDIIVAVLVFFVLGAFLWIWRGKKIERTSAGIDSGESLGAPAVPAALPSLPSFRAPSAAAEPGGETESADRAQLKIFDEILASRNDNDPRLDTALKILRPGTKRLLRDRYHQLAPEARNEKGTAVFLLGRNLSSPEDFRFLEEVLKEPPCLSLADCSRNPGAANRDQLHHELGQELTLAYPQIIALQMDEKYLRRQGTPPSLRALAQRNLETARTSPVAKVARMATEILERLEKEGT